MSHNVNKKPTSSRMYSVSEELTVNSRQNCYHSKSYLDNMSSLITLKRGCSLPAMLQQKSLRYQNHITPFKSVQFITDHYTTDS